MTHIEAMKQALEVLKADSMTDEQYGKTITDLEQAIATEESSATQEPVAWMSAENECIFFDADKPDPMDYDFWTPLYTHPQQKAEQEPKRELTDAEIYKVIDQTENAVGYAHNAWDMADQIELVRAILKAAHGIKDNT